MMSHRIRLVLIGVVILLLGFGIYSYFAPKSFETIKNPYAAKSTTIRDGDDSNMILGQFSGALPCADCEGIETYLTLYQDPQTGAATTFALKRRYLGTNMEPTVETGAWDYLRGTLNDPDATVYGLNPDKSKAEQQYFLKVDESRIVLLDSSMNEINSPLNFTLTKVE